MMYELYHYGKKGMKWGVRKAQAQKQVDIYRSGILKRHSELSTPISEKQYSQLASKSKILGVSGSKFLRVTGNPRGDGLTYVTNNKKDNDVYVALLAAQGKLKSDKFQMELSAVEKLISPSKKERVDTFIESLSDKVVYGGKVYEGREFFQRELSDRAASNRELGLKYYNDFVQSQTFNTPLHTKYFDKIREKGYNALEDDADSGIVSNTPIRLLTSSVKVDGVKKLTELDIVEAQERLNS